MSIHPSAVVFIALCLLSLTLIGVIIYKIADTQNGQNANYVSLKNEYIKKHPGQAIIPYPWEPSTSTKILPFNYEIPAAPSNNFSIIAARDQFEAASFIISAQKDLSKIQITVPDLYNVQGNRIPANAINVRTVKVWYQASDGDIWINKSEPRGFLTPELLLKDDSLVKVDYVNKTNFLRVTINGSQQYIDISTPTATFPANAEIHDSASLQPFSLKTNENKQIWLTVHVPNNTPDGDYYGDIAITAPSESPVIMTVRVTVLPFDLEPAPLRYILYYTGKLDTTPINKIGSEWKTAKQYEIELQDMKEHGILYPALYQTDDNTLVDAALSIRSQSGLPKDRIYVECFEIGNPTDPANLTKLANRVKTRINHTSAYGFGTAYFHGMDEVTGKLLTSQRDAWETVHMSGGRMVTTSWNTTDPIDLTGDILDAANIGTPVNTTAASVMHTYGHEIYLYNQPQVGIENPEIYRKNYGFTLWNSGYDGEMDFAYQWEYGDIWNDFDSEDVRDHVFAYPVTDGVIDTIQWEGWREGVDDTRYLATLIKKDGSNTSSRELISDSLAKGEDMATIRESVIERILMSKATGYRSRMHFPEFMVTISQ